MDWRSLASPVVQACSSSLAPFLVSHHLIVFRHILSNSPQSIKMTGSSHSYLPLPLSCLNHISRNCKNVEESISFYCNLLGFIQIRRPRALNFEGAWLYNYGIGIHLLHCEHPEAIEKKDEINVRADHISFQCQDMDMVEKRLKDADIKYLRRVVEEKGIELEQIFFHDPDGFMIEVCTCERLPVEPLAASVCLSKLYHIPSLQAKQNSMNFSPGKTLNLM